MSVFKKYISNNDDSATPASSPTSSTPRTKESFAASNKTSLKAPAPGSAGTTSIPTPTTTSTPAVAASKPLAQTPPAKQPVAQTPPVSAMPNTNGRNVLSSDVEINGKVAFTNDLVVDGLIAGEIHSDGSLTVGENARIKAEVHTRSVVVYGKVHGNITVSDRVELKANAELIGDIKAATISIEAGAIFVGKSTVGAPSIDVASLKSDNKSDAKSSGKPNQDNKKSDNKGKPVTAS